jgi:hypothetical protein
MMSWTSSSDGRNKECIQNIGQEPFEDGYFEDRRHWCGYYRVSKKKHFNKEYVFTYAWQN